MLTRRLAIANPMNFRVSYLLSQAIPLSIFGLQQVVVAEIPQPATTVAQTNIQSATADTIVVQESNQFNISGGQSSDGSAPNLVHQLENFDLNSGDVANFIVNPDVANVINLIDSVQPSSINGLLKLTSSDPNVASSANLFLVNSAGIIFGEDVSLNLPANLTATTSSGLLFQDRYLLSTDGTISEIALPGSVFSDSLSGPLESPTVNNLTGDPTGYLLLTDSASPVSLELSPTLPVGSIENRGNLQVSPQGSITLIGQYIQNDGTIAAPNGTVNLVATSGDNLLRISQPGNLLSLELVPVDTLAATDLAQLLTGGSDESATQIEIGSDGSQTLIGASSLTPAAGTVLIRGSIDVSDGMSPDQGNVRSQANILGNQINLVGGNIQANSVDTAGIISIGGMPMVDRLNAAYVVIDRDSQLSATSSAAQGGDIRVWADDTVQFYGEATVTGASSDLDGTISIDAGNVVDIRQPAARR